MPRPRQPVNLFYVLLLVASGAFCITACAYVVMMVKMTHGAAREQVGLIPFLARHGFSLLMGELCAIAIGTCGAIATEELRSRSQAENGPLDAVGSPIPENPNRAPARASDADRL